MAFMSHRIVNFYPSMSNMMVRRPKPRTQSAGVPAEPSPSARRGHVLPAAPGTDESPALRRLAVPWPYVPFARWPLVRSQVPPRPY